MSNDAKKYLDSEGLSYFWDKIKDYVGEAVESGTSDIANKIHFVVPNEKEATEALTAAVSDVDALSPGLVIALKMPFDSVASQTLNINSLGAKPIYYRNNTTDAGVFPSGAIVLLVYETTSVGTGCFKAVYSYDGAQPDVYQGATNASNGVAGLVPAAPSTDRDKFLKGDGTWENIDAIKTIDGNLECFNSSNIQTSNPDNWEANSVIVGPVIFVTGAVTGQSENNIWTNISPVIIQEDPHFNNSIEARRLTGTATGIESDVFYSSTDNTTTCWVIDLNTATFRGYPIFAFEGEITTENQYSQKLIKNGVIIIQNDGLPYTHSDKSIPFEYVEKTGWAIKGQVDFHYISSNSTYTISLDITIYTPAAWVIANNPSINIVSTKTDNRILNQNINLSCLLDNIDEKIEIIKHECNSIKQYKGAGISYNGVAGLVPAAPSADRDKYLKGDGTWDNEVLVLTVDPTASNAKTFNVVVSNDSVGTSAVPVTTTGNQTVGGQKTFTAGIYGGSITLASNVSTFDVSQAVCFTKTITANTTLSFSNVPADCVCCVSVILINGGNYAVTWPAGVKWTDNTMPVLTKNGTDVLTFITCTGGNVWYGATACTGVTA